MSTVITSTPPEVASPRRWAALGWAATGQLMIAADATIMNVALPTVQRDLALSPAQAQWVVTAFALCYGGFLLLGGRLSARWGRRRCLLAGLALFAVASLLGGLAVTPAMLITARAVQGLAGALFTPSVLALLGTSFPGGADRARAFGRYGTVMGSSTGVGLVLGGVLTDLAGWRWSLLVAVPIAAVAAAGVARTVTAGPGRADTPVDLVGAVLATGGLVALGYAASRAETAGWAGPSTLGVLAAGVAALGVFAAAQRRVAHPLLPPGVVADRRRGGAYLAVLAMAAGNVAAFFFLTFHLQHVLGFPPVLAGLAFLPYTLAIVLGVRGARRLLTDAPVRLLLVPGLLATAAGLGLLGLLRPDSGYATLLLPVIVLLGLGNAFVLVTANSVATQDAGPDAGVAGATVMTAMQVGASLGVAVLGGVAAAAADAHRRAEAVTAIVAGVHGQAVASLVAAVALAVAAVAVFGILGAGRHPARH
ncbi:MFS transporter [Micromonospora deserti]|uniref:MFS transporter n=1 Tax=Micromonospora deserti TaxID=2070366 RepID=A0A2W2CLI6_9ACTN|nr:MFS transporter [Micromonospora deserti]PZF86206.1 MFS transporter [Micromonospora deserti]